MEALIRTLQDEIDALDLEGKQTRLAKAEVEIFELNQRLAEVEHRIPFWDRAMFFVDTEDEAEAKALRKTIKNRVSALEEQRDTIEADWNAIAEQYPPYDIGRRIQRCRELTRELAAEDTFIGSANLPDTIIDALATELEAIGNSIVEHWIAEYDPEEIRDILIDPSKRSMFAGEPAEFDDDDRILGWSPIAQRQLLSSCATAIDHEGRYEQVRAEIENLEAERSANNTTLVVYEDKVTLWEKINFFSKSVNEFERDEAASALRKTQRELEYRGAELIHLVESSLGVFPPVRVQIAAHEALGAVRSMRIGSEPTLNSEGKPIEVSTVDGREMALAAIERLAEAFAKAFPGVPIPSAPVLSRPGPLAKSFAEALDQSDTYEAVEHGLGHAHLETTARVLRDRVSERVGWLDRAAFWSDTDDEQERERLDDRVEWYREAQHTAQRELERRARGAAAAFPPLVLRDWAVFCAAAVEEIHTDPGTSSAPKSCSVYGREEANEAIRGIRQVMENKYGFRRGRRGFVKDVAAAVREGTGVDAPDSKFEPLPYDDIVKRVAGRLRNTQFDHYVEQVETFESAYTRADRKRSEAEANISIWDRINIFTKTTSEMQRDAMKAELEKLDNKLDVGIGALDDLIENAMDAYPPARLYYRLEHVREAVSDIRAVCRSRTVSSGTGKNRTTRTVYYCDLVGKSEALDTVYWWNQTFLSVFGNVPMYSDLLAQWLVHRRR